MAKMLLTVFLTILSLSIYADEKETEKEIKLEIEKLENDSRSLVNVPTATHVGSTLYLYSDLTIENAVVCIKKLSTGDTIYTENVCISSNSPTIVISPMGLSEGEYVLQVSIGNNVYWGIFFIEQ